MEVQLTTSYCSQRAVGKLGARIQVIDLCVNVAELKVC